MLGRSGEKAYARAARNFPRIAKGENQNRRRELLYEDGLPVPLSLHAKSAGWAAGEMLGVKIKNGVRVGNGFPEVGLTWGS